MGSILHTVQSGFEIKHSNSLAKHICLPFSYKIKLEVDYFDTTNLKREYRAYQSDPINSRTFQKSTFQLHSLAVIKMHVKYIDQL